MAEQWASLLQECPDDLLIVRHCATRLVKERRIEEAMSLVDRHLPESPNDSGRLFARAKLLSDIRAHEPSDALFRRLISQHTDRNMLAEFAHRLPKRGFLAEAFQVIAPVVKTLAHGSTAAELAAGRATNYESYLPFNSAEAVAGTR